LSYSVKEIYLTLQGEGAQQGRAAVFCRFAGCNLWSGKEIDRSTAACNFCDTDFVGTDGTGGAKYPDVESLAGAIELEWAKNVESNSGRLVVFTGGEPALQLTGELTRTLRSLGFQCAIETNGTLPIKSELDWITVSPKTSQKLEVFAGDELKLVYPQQHIKPELFETLDFRHFFLQPKDDENFNENLSKSIEYCLKHPRWRLSIQTHKYIGID
jgi:7-carboxy-7-deazaguanine synthase (Cx14CxxC type)